MLNLRDNTQYKEIIEMKKVYKHPLYEYPSLYNDVAVIELGRRIEYDFDKYGDSPTCMARPEQTEIEGKIATVQVNKVKISKTRKYGKNVLVFKSRNYTIQNINIGNH